MNNPIINDIEFLRNKASTLPRLPGVYIMEDKKGEVIYVGKSRSLRDRVSQYFHGTHDLKTSKMASNVNNFRFVVCNTEMDALVLENNLIKQYTPKYNILLKDSKSYPYILVTDEKYPRIVMTRKRGASGRYFGPYSGAGVVYSIINVLERTLGIPSCKHSFPRDIGKIRPCVYRQIGRCCGVCAGDVEEAEYSRIIECAIQILKGNTKGAKIELEERMHSAAEEEKFEEAARCRDGIAALSRLTEKHRNLMLPAGTECDVIAITEVGRQQCGAVFYVRDGIISDSEQFIFGADEITGYVTRNEMDTFELENAEFSEDSPLTAFITNLYMGREYIPSEILLSFDMSERDKALVGEYLSGRAGRTVTLKTPQRGEKRRVCEMAENDAKRHFESRRARADADERLLAALASKLALEVLPERIECYDISNYGSEFITAGMIVAENGHFKKSDYRYFRIKGTEGQDDYGAMREALSRRFSHIGGEDRSFAKTPDLILLDGGATHVAVIKKLEAEMGLDIPVFGMVKDSHHKTRTLVNESEEISIATEIPLFQFIYKLQEEVHRFSVKKMTDAKLKTIKTSGLEKIPGVGPARAKALLSKLDLETIKKATAQELTLVKGITGKVAENIVRYFNENK